MKRISFNLTQRGHSFSPFFWLLGLPLLSRLVIDLFCQTFLEIHLFFPRANQVPFLRCPLFLSGSASPFLLILQALSMTKRGFLPFQYLLASHVPPSFFFGKDYFEFPVPPPQFRIASFQGPTVPSLGIFRHSFFFLTCANPPLHGCFFFSVECGNAPSSPTECWVPTK